MTMYHGTDNNFDVFDFDFVGKNHDISTGVFFTSEKNIAEMYGDNIKTINIDFDEYNVVEIEDGMELLNGETIEIEERMTASNVFDFNSSAITEYANWEDADLVRIERNNEIMVVVFNVDVIK